MRKKWKRILAAVLAACMIFCDSSLIYAAESQPMEDSVTDVEEETETTEEEVAEISETTEEEVVEISETTEEVEAEQTLSTEDGTVLISSTQITEAGYYSQAFTVTPTVSGNYRLYVKGDTTLYMQCNEVNNPSIVVDSCYDYDEDAESSADVVTGKTLTAGTEYKITVYGTVADTETFCLKKIENEPTVLTAGSNTETVAPGELKLYTIKEDELKTGAVCWTGSYCPEIAVFSSESSYATGGSYRSSDSKSGEIVLAVPVGTTYYISVRNTSETDSTNVTWKYVDTESIAIGDTKEITAEENGTQKWKLYEFDASAEKDYLISAHPTPSNSNATSGNNYCQVFLLMEDDSICGYNSYYSNSDGTSQPYGDGYVDGNDVYWIRIQFPPKCKKIYVCGYQSSTYYTTQVRLEEIVHPASVTANTTVTIDGGTEAYELDKWYQITPSEDAYYYLDSEDLTAAEIGIWNEASQNYDITAPDYFYAKKTGASAVTDVRKCIKLVGGTTYGIHIKGTVPTSGTTFTWTTIDAYYAPSKLELGKSLSIDNSMQLYEISSEEAVLGKLSFADYGYGTIAIYGDDFESIYSEEGTNSTAKKNYIMALPAGKKVYVALKTSTTSTLSWNAVETTTLEDGADITLNPTEATAVYYEFTPDSKTTYQLQISGGTSNIYQMGSDGEYKNYSEKITDSDGEWLVFDKVADVEKVYIAMTVEAGAFATVKLKKSSTAVDVSTINNTLTVDQEVYVSGGESGNSINGWYKFTPTKTGYYYLESDTFKTGTVANAETWQYYNLDMKCAVKPGAESTSDVVVSYLFEEGVEYQVQVYGSVAAGESKTFTWKECTLEEQSQTVSINGGSTAVPGGAVSVYKLSTEKATTINISVNGWDRLNVYGSSYEGQGGGGSSDGTKYYNYCLNASEGATYFFVLAPTTDASITVSEDVVKYSITYVLNGGKLGEASGTAVEYYTAAEEYTLPIPEYNGYTFEGWYTKDTLEEQYKVSSIPEGSEGDKTFYAKWTLANYLINYELDGGKFTSDANLPSTYTCDKHTVIPTPTRLGYEFGGWYREVICSDGGSALEILPKYYGDDGLYYIPYGTTGDINLIAKWNFTPEFDLLIDGQSENIVITHPYNTATGQWDPDHEKVHFNIRSNTLGVIPVLYAIEDEETNTYSVEAKISKYLDTANAYVETVSWKNAAPDDWYEWEEYDVTLIDSDVICEPGKYRLEVVYTHPETDSEGQYVKTTLVRDFTVEYAKREYPVNKEVTWAKLSSVDAGLKFGDIKTELAEAMLKDTSVCTACGERVFNTGDVLGITVKNAKKNNVSDKTKVTNGTYTVVLKFNPDTNDCFLEEATATVKISYGTVTNAGVLYEVDDNEVRTAGPAIGYDPIVEGSTVVNATQYPTGVKVTPMVKVPWSEDAIPTTELQASLDANGYSGYTVSVTFEETAKTKILSAVPDGQTDQAVCTWKVNGLKAGKTTVVLKTQLTKQTLDGEQTLTVPVTVKNFTVVDGSKAVVKEIIFNKFYTLTETDEGTQEVSAVKHPNKADTYLVETNAAEARKYYIDCSAYDYINNLSSNALTWTSSNKGLAAAAVNKQGKVEVTIPKKAQGVVEITATAKDTGKKAQKLTLILADTSMRLETATVTLNSKLKDARATAQLYPNVTSVDLSSFTGGSATLQGRYNNDTVKLYDKVKDPVTKQYNYVESAMFVSDYNVSDGRLVVSFKEGVSYPVKAATYTVYVGVHHDGEAIPSEVHTLKIKDTCAMPKAAAMKVTKSYEMAYKNTWAEATVTLKSPAALDSEGTPAIQAADTSKFEVIGWEDISGFETGDVWKLKIRVKDESLLPTGKQNAKTTKNVEFVIGYDGYRTDAVHKVKANITVTKTIPTLSVYGETVYAPVYYTDLNYRYVDVVIPVTEAVLDGISYTVGVINDDGSVTLASDDRYVTVALKDTSKFEIVDAVYDEDDVYIPAKKGYTEVEYPIKVRVKVKEDQAKKVNLQFTVSGSGLSDGTVITTKALAINPRKVSADAITLNNLNNGSVVKTLTFNSLYAGKETSELYVNLPQTLMDCAYGGYLSVRTVVEGADATTKKMLQNEELLLEVDEMYGQIVIRSTENSFKYKTAKLKVTVKAANGADAPEFSTKSTVLTVSFKKLTPKVTFGAAKVIRGLYGHKASFNGYAMIYYSTGASVNIKYANLPVGAVVTDIRFADPADATRYYDPYWYGDTPSWVGLNVREETKLTTGKKVINMIVDLRTSSGDIISVPSSITLTVADSYAIKADTKSINLYNSAVGSAYGKYVTFSDAKGHAVKVLEIVNEAELQKAGINFDLNAVNESDAVIENMKESDGQDAVKFYVDRDLKRGIEKTYTVKAKVGLLDSVSYPDGEAVTTNAAEKIITFKIVLKK